MLLTPDAVAQVRAALDGADAVAAMARKASVLAAHPEGQRNFYRFRDDEYANCNIYGLANRKAIDAGARDVPRRRPVHEERLADDRRVRAAQHRAAAPRRSSAARPPCAASAAASASSVEAIEFTDGSLAVDVDNERTYRVCEEMLAKRAAAEAA